MHLSGICDQSLEASATTWISTLMAQENNGIMKKKDTSWKKQIT